MRGDLIIEKRESGKWHISIQVNNNKYGLALAPSNPNADIKEWISMGVKKTVELLYDRGEINGSNEGSL